VQDAARSVLAGAERIHLTSAVDYPSFAGLLRSAYLVLTDSGGIQEEAPALGKPVLVLRTVTERPEGVAAGAARLVGTDEHEVAAALTVLLDDSADYAKMASAGSPYGDGMASQRIAEFLAKRLGE
jgi:UDP-N-acetylglucosamine 2-epimerase (non-hydrolysing)